MEQRRWGLAARRPVVAKGVPGRRQECDRRADKGAKHHATAHNDDHLEPDAEDALDVVPPKRDIRIADIDIAFGHAKVLPRGIALE